MTDQVPCRTPIPRAAAAWLAALLPLLACGAAQAATMAATRPPLAPHQLWTSHGLAALLVALAVFLVARSLPLAGIMVVGAVWYAVATLAGPSGAPEVLAQLGPRYAFHVQATAVLIPAAALVGLALQRSARRASLARHGLAWMLGPSRD